MRIGYLTNGRSCEYEMQNMFKLWLKEKDLRFINEFKIQQIVRIPDFLILKGGNGLINVEAKCNAFECLLDQLDDNSAFCRYSFAYITDICHTPVWFKKRLIDSGYGLIVYNTHTKIISEVLEAHRNKNFNKDLNRIVVSRIEKELILRKKALQVDTQSAIEFLESFGLKDEIKTKLYRPKDLEWCIPAIEMTEYEYLSSIKPLTIDQKRMQEEYDRPGYKVKFPGSIDYWISELVFLNAFQEVEPNNAHFIQA